MENKFNDTFFCVKASELRVDDSFMKNLPKTEAERELMISLVVFITQGAKDFYCFKRDPLIADVEVVHRHIVVAEPLKGLSYYEWEKVARSLDYDRNSRIGAKREYVLLLGVLIKKLVRSGWTIEDAWDVVCNNPKKLFECNIESEEISILINILKTCKILSVSTYDKRQDVAFYVVKTNKSLLSFDDITYNISEYDSVMDMYFSDYIPPSTGNPFQQQLNELSREATDVKGEIREEIAWIVMDVK